jgi:aminoglycoside phosphotransferase (APT) family kinase protein
MVADIPLWRGLLDDARKRFPKIITGSVWRRRGDLIDRLEDWHSTKDGLPSTLAHDDFNQRNIGFRPAPVVLDWELARLNTAHRDLVELLTFVLPPSADRSQVDAHLERHRANLAALGVSSLPRRQTIRR